MQLNKRLEVSVTPVAAKFQLPGPRSPSPTSGGSGSNSAAAAGGGEFPVHSRGGFSSSKRPFTSAPTSVLKQSKNNMVLTGSGLGTSRSLISPQSSISRPFTASTTSRDPNRPKLIPNDIISQSTMSQPFGCPKSNTAFGAAYAEGEIPCRVNHSTKTKQLAWHSPPSSMPSYNPLLVILFQGLLETNYPYTFIVREGIKDLLEAEGSKKKVLSCLRMLIKPLRDGLGSPEKESTIVSLNVFIQLAAVIGPAIVPFLQTLLSPLATKALKREGGEIVIRTLQQVELIVANWNSSYDDAEELNYSVSRGGGSSPPRSPDSRSSARSSASPSRRTTSPPLTRSPTYLSHTASAAALPITSSSFSPPRPKSAAAGVLVVKPPFGSNAAAVAAERLRKQSQQAHNEVFVIIKAKIPKYISCTELLYC